MALTEARAELAPAQPLALPARAAPGLASVPEEDWDRLVPAGHSALRHRFLRAFEQAELSGLEARPLLAFASDSPRPIGACPGYWYDLDLAGARLPAAAGVLGTLRRHLPHLLMARTFELGCQTPLTSPFLVAPSARSHEVVASLAEAGLGEGERGRAQFQLVQNFASLDSPAVECLQALGFVAVPILPTVVVELCFGSFEDYLSAMRSQYRRRAQQTLRRSTELRVEHVRDFSPLADELARLWRLIYERASELRREILTPAYFRAVAAVEESSALLLRRADGSLASFALLLEERPWLSFLQCGFDAEAGRSEGVYFRLLYELVRLGIEGGFEQLELGMTTLAPKLDIGGVPVPLYALLRHRNAVLHRLITRLANGPMRPPEAAPRHVFKEPPPTAVELVARRGAS